MARVTWLTVRRSYQRSYLAFAENLANFRDQLNQFGADDGQRFHNNVPQKFFRILKQRNHA
jgi:hypothetical protein